MCTPHDFHLVVCAMHTCQCFIRMQGQLRELHPKAIRRLQVPSKTPRQRAHRCSNPARGLLLPACTSDASQQSSSLLELEPHATPVCGTGTCCHQLAQQHSSCGAAAPSSCCCCCCASWQLGKCPYRPQPPPPQRAAAAARHKTNQKRQWQGSNSHAVIRW